MALPEVAAADLDITIVGQLAAAQLGLGDQIKPGPLQVVRLKTSFDCHAPSMNLWERWKNPAARTFGLPSGHPGMVIRSGGYLRQPRRIMS